MTLPNTIPDGKRNVYHTVEGRVLQARGLSLFLDYDGTLTPIRRLPHQAILPRSAAKLLRELVRQKGISVTIVTGRSIKDVRRFVSDPRIACITNHGFHIVNRKGKAWTHPVARQSKLRLQRICADIERVTAGVKGAHVEYKGLTASVHYRNVQSHTVRSLRTRVQAVLRAAPWRFRVVEGKKVTEIRPASAWGKGHAVKRLLRQSKHTAGEPIVYIGDDTTDEDAFTLLRSRGITIRVGHSTTTAAQFTVRNPTEVRKIFRRILNAWKRRSAAAEVHSEL